MLVVKAWKQSYAPAIDIRFSWQKCGQGNLVSGAVWTVLVCCVWWVDYGVRVPQPQLFLSLTIYDGQCHCTLDCWKFLQSLRAGLPGI